MHCEPADNFASIKAKASKLLNIEQGQMGLFATRDKVSEKSEKVMIAMGPPDHDKTSKTARTTPDRYLYGVGRAFHLRNCRATLTLSISIDGCGDAQTDRSTIG